MAYLITLESCKGLLIGADIDSEAEYLLEYQICCVRFIQVRLLVQIAAGRFKEAGQPNALYSLSGYLS